MFCFCFGWEPAPIELLLLVVYFTGRFNTGQKCIYEFTSYHGIFLWISLLFHIHRSIQILISYHICHISSWALRIAEDLMVSGSNVIWHSLRFVDTTVAIIQILVGRDAAGTPVWCLSLFLKENTSPRSFDQHWVSAGPATIGSGAIACWGT